MYYNDFKDIKFSALGLGCMRLPVIDGDDSRPDKEQVQAMVDYAMANGINYYDTASDDDIASLLTAAHFSVTGKEAGTVPCTACRYCTTHCPKELDIPWLLSLYNEHAYSEGGFIAPMALASLDKDKLPSACIGCGSCAKVCPQQIDIPGVMKKFTELIAK